MCLEGFCRISSSPVSIATFECGNWIQSWQELRVLILVGTKISLSVEKWPEHEACLILEPWMHPPCIFMAWCVGTSVTKKFFNLNEVAFLVQITNMVKRWTGHLSEIPYGTVSTLSQGHCCLVPTSSCSWSSRNGMCDVWLWDLWDYYRYFNAFTD